MVWSRKNHESISQIARSGNKSSISREIKRNSWTKLIGWRICAIGLFAWKTDVRRQACKNALLDDPNLRCTYCLCLSVVATSLTWADCRQTTLRALSYAPVSCSTIYKNCIKKCCEDSGVQSGARLQTPNTWYRANQDNSWACRGPKRLRNPEAW